MTIAFFPAIATVSIPKIIFLIGLIGILVAGFAEFRRGYIGRVAIFLNAILLWQIFYPAWDILPIWFQWYLNVGSIVGLIAIFSYFLKGHLITEFYKFCYFLYGSFSIIFAILIAVYFKIPFW